MSEKKYLLTASDLCKYGLAVTDNLGLGDTETFEFIGRFLAEHEYREPTCRDDGIEAFRCTRCGAFVHRDSVTDLCGPIPIKYCPNCRARVVDGDD